MREDRDTTQKNGKDEMIKDIRKRLNWYNFYASEEEYNAEEVEALVNLLGIMEPLDTENTVDPQKAYEKFIEYRTVKAEDAKRLAALHGKVTDMETACMDMSGEVSAMRKEHGKIRMFMVRHKGAVCTAAAMLVILIAAGGTMGAVNAEKNQGFFYWLNKDDSGETILISPQEDEDTNMRIYYSIEDIPEEYQEHMIDIQKMESLKGYSLQEIEIDKLPLHDEMLLWLMNDENKSELVLGKIIYRNEIMKQRKEYIDYTYLYSKEVQGLEMDIFMRQDAAGQEDYAVCFYTDNAQYFVASKQLPELMEQIAEEYFKIVSAEQ